MPSLAPPSPLPAAAPGGDTPPRQPAPGCVAGRLAASLLLALGLIPGILLQASAAVPHDPLEQLALPPLRIDGLPAQAHTQGLEVIGTNLYVTARREDTHPRQALLLRTARGRSDWDTWTLTPPADTNSPSTPPLDHPGGIQFDGSRLWIPVAESRRGGWTCIAAYALSSLLPGQTARPDRTIYAPDHIGAIAVSRRRRELFGANWDTETIYQWDFDGRLKRRLSACAQPRLGLGPLPQGGLAVQDWKLVGNRLYAAGLLKASSLTVPPPASRLISLPRRLGPDDAPEDHPLPRLPDLEIAREGMTIAERKLWFLPADLGASNTLFRLPLPRSARR